MVVISPPLPALALNTVSLYYCRDPLLEDSPVFVFYGPSTVGNSTHNSSRIQAHIYSQAGFQTFPRLTISPTSPLYIAVNHLPAEKRGEEICRGLAVSLLSYFAAIPKATKNSLSDLEAGRRPNRLAPAMFDEMHAGDLAAKMVKVEDPRETVNFLTSALSPRAVSWLDLDILLPPKTIERFMSFEGSEPRPMFGEDGLPLFHYGLYTSLVNHLGTPAFLPTSILKRAPSRPTAHSKTRLLSKDQKISLRREMCELLDTEERYISKLQDLVRGIESEFRKLHMDAFGNVKSNETTVNQLFPESLQRILKINTRFYDDLQSILHLTENEAIRDIEEAPGSTTEHSIKVTDGRKRDPTGTASFAKALLKWFPDFTGPYQDYMRASMNFPEIMNDALQDQTSIFSRQVHEFGEQRLRSILIEPVQRLPRYSLFIDNMVNLLPASHPASITLLKARDNITDICALDAETSDGTKVMSCLTRLVANWPKSQSPNGRLITAVDVIELDPPYTSTDEGQCCVILLFPDTVVLLQKSHPSAFSARGILAEVDRPVVPASMSDDSLISPNKGLSFAGAFNLLDVQVDESEDGRLIWLAGNGRPSMGLPPSKSTARSLRPFAKTFVLLSPYERKAARLSEEIAKARIEGRFPESIRESDKWALRSLNASSDALGILAAVLEDGNTDALQPPSRIRVFVDSQKTPKSIIAGNLGVDVIACITPLDLGRCRLYFESSDGSRVTEETTELDVGTALVRICESRSPKIWTSLILG